MGPNLFEAVVSAEDHTVDDKRLKVSHSLVPPSSPLLLLPH
jgi:hypothetical protein